MIQALSRRVWGLLFLAGGLLGVEQQARALPAVTAQEGTKNHVWSLSLHSERHHLTGDDGFQFIGNSGQVAVGYGYVQGGWFIAAEAGVMVGPFAPAYAGAIDADYQGTGMKLWWGFSLPQFDLRRTSGSLGLGLAVNYADFTGRSFRTPHSQQELARALTAESEGPANHTSHTYALRIVNLGVSPTIFYCWLEKARRDGNDTEQLITRIEGYVLSLAFALPVMASYQSRYVAWKQVPAEDEEGVESWREQPQSERGGLAGYTVLLGLTALLGS